MKKKAVSLLMLCLFLTGCSAEELVQKGTQFLDDLFVSDDRPYVQIIPDGANTGAGNTNTGDGNTDKPPVEAEEPSIPAAQEPAPSPEPAEDDVQEQDSGNPADITPSHTDVTLFYSGEGFLYQPRGVSGVYACTYSSDAPEIAAVDETTGRVTAVSPGTTVVRMHVESSGQYDFSCTVRCSWKADETDKTDKTAGEDEDGPVLPPAEPADTASVGASHTDVTLFNPNESFRLLPTGINGDAVCAYSSDNPDVAKVDALTGAVTAVGPGRTTVTMSVDWGGNEYEFTCIVRCSW